MITPIKDNVLVKLFPPRETTKSGLYIPLIRIDANNNTEMVRAEVVRVGEGVQTQKGIWVKPNIKVGDIVFYGGRKYTGTEYEEKGEKYQLIREIDILFKLDEEEGGELNARNHR